MYTRDEVMSMNAGRELDAMVAEHVMGWELRQVGNGSMDGEYYWHDGCDFVDGRLANLEFSTYISAAWEVIEKLHEQNYLFSISQSVDAGYTAKFFNRDKECYFVAPYIESAPLAICIAALLTLIKED